MSGLRSLSKIDSSTLARYRADPCAFIEECLISPYDGQPYRLIEAERQFIRHAFQLDDDGRLRYPLLVYGAIKKSRKTELAALITIATIVLFGGKYAEGYVVANTLNQATSLCFTGCRRILEASPLFRNEVHFTQDRILFTATQSSITAIANNASGLAGVHPTISVHDEAWASASGERGRAVFDQLIPVPSRKISCRLVVSHAGIADPDLLLYQLYQRGMQLPEIGTDLRAGDGMLMHWSHTPMHPWQDEKWLQDMRRELTPAKYTYMVENRFAVAASAYITEAMFDKCIKEVAPCSGRLAIYVAVDAGWKRDNAAVVAVTVDGDHIRFVYAKIFKPSPDDPLNFENTIERTLLELNQRYTIRLCWVDPTQMEYMKERLRKTGIPIEALTQNPENLTAMAQTLYDLFRTERFIIPSNLKNDNKLRETITRTVFEEKSGGLRFAKNQSIKTGLTVALAMACLAATQRSGKSTYRLDVFDSDFRDEDLPPLPSAPEPASGAVCGTSDWWKFKQHLNSYTGSADTQLKSLYGAVDNFFRHR
jgi:hypothetical protein